MRKRSVAQVRPGPAQAARRRLCVVDGRRAAPHPGRGAPAPHPGGASRAADAGKVAAPKAPPIEFERRVAHRREQYNAEASPCPPPVPPPPRGRGEARGLRPPLRRGRGPKPGVRPATITNGGIFYHIRQAPRPGGCKARLTDVVRGRHAGDGGLCCKQPGKNA